ncbi:MAG: 5-(carboxyamino)imidazole ribonucleotide synthase [Polynucleobacter sp.]|jgi:5-(carboxyamino)imidazole ribonucleotide synthase|nr:5-(carboxyamino)imidazole ribonucleotide synthase [Polynucleobacter sp.]
MTHSFQPIFPPACLGILGGGQLGRFFVQAAQDLGFTVCVLDPDSQSPAGQISHHRIIADYHDEKSLEKMAHLCSAVSTEFENVPALALDFLHQQGVYVAPLSNAVSIAQDRFAEKAFLSKLAAKTGIEPVPYAMITNERDLSALPMHLFPGILKTARLGYDGKGQFVVASQADLKNAWVSLGNVPCVLEKKMPLALEVSAIVTRGFDDHVAIFPLAENVHKEGILHLSIVPARSLSPEAMVQIEKAAKFIVRELQYVGVLCIEFFILTDGTVVANEIAPRPHNSGHHTLDSCLTSQFEQQVRALARLPLGDTRLTSSVVMLNLLGEVWLRFENSPPWDHILEMPSARLHLYGKHAPKIGRKMGHINFLADSMDLAMQDAQQAMQILGIVAD